MKTSLYNRYIRRSQATDLEGIVASHVLDEIAVLRLVFRRLLEEISMPPGDENAPSRKELAYILGALGLASNRIADLLKKQQDLGGAGDPLSRAISQALAEVTKELNLT